MTRIWLQRSRDRYEVGGNVKTDELTKLQEQIIRVLEKLPSKSVKRLDHTQDQIDYWLGQRTLNSLAAIYWRSRLTGYNNPLDDLVKSGEIKSWDRETTVARVDVLQRFWELIHLGEPYIKQEAEKRQMYYPFTAAGNRSAQALFKRILIDWENGYFQMCELSHLTISVGDSEKVAKMALAICNGSRPKPQKLIEARVIANRFPKNPWFTFAMAVYESKAVSDSLIGTKYKDFLAALGFCAEQKEQECKRKRSSSKFEKTKSYEWQNGKCVYAQLTGGVYKTSQQGANHFKSLNSL